MSLAAATQTTPQTEATVGYVCNERHDMFSFMANVYVTKIPRILEFYHGVSNSLREAQSNQPVDCRYISPLQRLSDSSFWSSLPKVFFTTTPKNPTIQHFFSEACSAKAPLSAPVSPAVNEIVESKNNTAEAFSALRDPQKAPSIIESYLKEAGRFDESLKRTLINQALTKLPETGVLRFVDNELTLLLTHYKDKGIVFQTNRSLSGDGTLILKPDEIKQMLKSSAPLKDQLIEKFEQKSRSFTSADFDQGLSWQELIPFREEKILSYIGCNSAQQLMEPLITDGHTDSNTGKYLGGTVNKAANTLLDSSNLSLLLEIAVDYMLKAKNVEGGIKSVWNKNEMNYLNVDLLIADDGRVTVSEFNARPSGATHARGAFQAFSIDDKSCSFTRLACPKLFLSHKQVYALMENKELVSQTLLGKLKTLKDRHKVPEFYVDSIAINEIDFDENDPQTTLGLTFWMLFPHRENHADLTDEIKAATDFNREFSEFVPLIPIPKTD